MEGGYSANQPSTSFQPAIFGVSITVSVFASLISVSKVVGVPMVVDD